LRMAGGQEMRALYRAAPAGREPFLGYSLHPGGRLLAASTKSGVGFFDLIGDEEVGFVPGRFSAQIQFDQTGALWTIGEAGLLRWPVRVAHDAARPYCIGPPEWVADRHRATFALSADGRVAAVPLAAEETLVIHRGPPRRVVRLGPQKDVRYVHVSPDGRWVVTGTHHYDDAGPNRYKVWDAESGQLAANLPISEVVKVNGISPDSRWLYVSGKEDRRLEIASVVSRSGASGPEPKWRSEPMRQADAYSPANLLAAFGQSDGSIRLVRTDRSNEEIVRLQAPEAGRLSPNRFSPDGALLLADGEETGTCYLFDLRRIRAQLAELDLDWQAPPYPPARTEETDPALVPPLRIEPIRADAAANGPSMAAHEGRLAVAQLYINPLDAEAHLRLGQRLLQAGKLQPAYAHLSAALAFRPNLDAALVPWARAAYRLERWGDAINHASRCLEKWEFNLDAREIRAVALMERRRYPEAVADLSTLIVRQPSWAQLYQWRAHCYEALGDRARVISDREKILEEGHFESKLLSNEARHLLAGPSGWRDPECALRMSRLAVARQPANAAFLGTLGLAEYRSGRYKEAVMSLEKSLASGKAESDGLELFALAMCHARLRAGAKARDCFDQAVRRVSQQKHLAPERVEELTALRAEAEAVLQGK
jgi:tetratricopeptide (TPR) repeat protein